MKLVFDDYANEEFYDIIQNKWNDRFVRVTTEEGCVLDGILLSREDGQLGLKVTMPGKPELLVGYMDLTKVTIAEVYYY